MDLKKAKLTDEAALYNRGPEKTDRQKWAEMNGRQRWDFFKSYYLLKVIVGIGIVAAVIYFIYSIVKPKPTIVLNIASNGYITVPYSELSKEFLELNGYNTKDYEISVDPTYNLNTDSLSMQRFNVYSFTGDMDMLISGNEAFERYAANSFMKPLDEIMPAEQLAWFEEHGLTYTTTRKDFDDAGVLIKEYEPHVYGILLDKTSVFGDFATAKGSVIVGIITKSSNQQSGLDFIQFLYDKYSKGL